jgi:hypothetical protein
MFPCIRCLVAAFDNVDCFHCFRAYDVAGWLPSHNQLMAAINHDRLTPVLSCPLECNWLSPTQSLLVAAPSGPMAILCFFQTFTCFEMGSPLGREEGSDGCWSLPVYWGMTLMTLTHSLTHSVATSHPASLHSLSTDLTENTFSNISSIVACVSVAAEMFLTSRYHATGDLFWLHYSGFQMSRHTNIYLNFILQTCLIRVIRSRWVRWSALVTRVSKWRTNAKL